MHERKEDQCEPHKEMEVAEKNRCRVRKRPTCNDREEVRREVKRNQDKCFCDLCDCTKK